ncbi:MAG: hypothetical protein J2P33_07075, partial [Actinobacteria bacterium]|nr:hypothetical protein [Actinomycetota bacterium]
RSAEMIASLVAMDIAGTCADLRRAGVTGDGLAWFGGCETVPAAVLAGLPAVGAQAGLGCVFITTSAPVAGELARQAGVLVVHRLTDRGLAAQVAARTGTQLVPADAGQLSHPAPAAGLPALAAGMPHAAGMSAAGKPTAIPTGLPAAAAAALPAAGATGTQQWPGAAATPWNAAAVPGVPFGAALAPVIPADVLCRLGDGEFSLVTGSLPDRVVQRARAVAGRVPRYRPVRQRRLARLDRATGMLPAAAAAQPAPEPAQPAPGQEQP